MRRLLLGGFYFLVLTPMALVIRLVRDPLRRRPDPRLPSYWSYPADHSPHGPR